uniref:Gfo/Idh/MocA family protein n=1 Tax=Herbidospora sakaeratensis TaxID=564415 RepID=UPI000A54DE6D|nr:Gfo/Idh/MocA family oxidoreductase [Herbidospora sakaeratensis]
MSFPLSTLGVGVIGLSARGGWASIAHVPALNALRDRFELRALSTSSAESARAAGERYGVPLAFGAAEELVRRPEVDLVVVSVDVAHHRDLVATALAAGKHVLSEWPLGRSLAEAEEMAALADRAGVRGFTGLHGRSLPALRYLRDLVADGYVGEALSTTMIGSGIQWGATVFPGGEPQLHPANGVTMLTSPFALTVDVLTMVLGEFTELTATTAVRRPRVTTASGQRVPMTADDQIAVTGRLDGGAVAAVHFRGGLPRSTPFHWEISGTEGDLLVTASSGQLYFPPPVISGARLGDPGLAELPVPAGYESGPALAAHSGGPAYAVGHAYATLHADLTGGPRVAPDLRHGVRRHRLLDAVERAAATGRRVLM